ncbi:MAG TPA: DUF2235 domain-containing protein [Albitalea sp.]|nr:DUF2235 domain-containing protein [Albitalea sp.]
MDSENGVSIRQIVVCCDGTNNTLTGGVADTNVVRLYEVIAKDSRPNRVLYYDRGVGSPDAVPPAGFLDWMRHTTERLSALASGSGVYENISRAYIFLMHQWREPSDEIYLFGFSRGAFTARAVAGMVNLFGIIRPEHESMVPALVSVYFSPTGQARHRLPRMVRWLHRRVSKKGQEATAVDGRAQDAEIDRDALAAQMRRMFASGPGSAAWVHFVGVWDTVESVGLPGPLSRKNPGSAVLHGKRIHHVRHALSLDEHRWTFEPRLYEEPSDIDTPTQTLKQRWFPGVHCDVGGSYPSHESALSENALRWMIDELNGHLFIGPPPVAAAQAVPASSPGKSTQSLRHDPLWNTPWWALAGMTVRDMAPQVAATPDLPAQPMQVIEHLPPPSGMVSVWKHRRSVVWLAIAAALALLFWVLSGLCLLPAGTPHDDWLQLSLDALAAASAFAQLQLASLWGAGLLAGDTALWKMPAQPGWAMFWDLAFIAAYGYLVARITSRAFTVMVGLRKPGEPMPAWRWLGLAPLVLVGADVVEDLLTWAALGAHGLGSDVLGNGLLWLTGLASLAKLAGGAGCALLVGVRYWLSMQPKAVWEWPDHETRGTLKRARQTRHHAGDVYAAAVLALVLMAVYALARAAVCWGNYAWGGMLGCHSHYLLGAAVVAGVWLVVRMFRELIEFRSLGGWDRLHVVATTLLTVALLAAGMATALWTDMLL